MDIDTIGMIFSNCNQLIGFADELDFITRYLGRAEAIYARQKSEIRFKTNASNIKYKIIEGSRETNRQRLLTAMNLR